MGMPSPGWNALVRESAVLARRRRRRRRRQLMLWLLTIVTAAALLVIVILVKDMARMPTVASLSSSARTVSRAAGPAHRVSPRVRTSPRPEAAPTGAQVTDATSGLSYQSLPAPWGGGCPATLDAPMFSWSAGESAVAGQVTMSGSTFDWHGVACSGQLQPQFPYSGPADLETTTMSLIGTLDPLYYNPLVHSRAVLESSALQVSGHQGWVVKFLISYSDAGAEGLSWTSELGGVVVADRGTGHAPAVFYVSVPANLGASTVDALIGSLRLS